MLAEAFSEGGLGVAWMTPLEVPSALHLGIIKVLVLPRSMKETLLMNKIAFCKVGTADLHSTIEPMGTHNAPLNSLPSESRCPSNYNPQWYSIP
jgi:hypothetical protein